MIRVFNYLNISNTKNIWADSGYHVQRNVINYILRRRDDFFFYITIPKGQVQEALKGFEYPDRIQVIPISYSDAGALNKMFIDLKSLKEKFNPRHYFINIIWSNEAYLTLYLLQLFKGSLPFSGAAVATYVHWVELPELNRIGDKYRANWQLWLLAVTTYWSDYVFFLSNYAIKTIVPYFQLFLRDDIYNEIRGKMKVLYHGIPVEELDKYKHDERSDVPLFVFNHRLMQYTGATVVIRVVKQLIMEGLKFKIVFTNPSRHSIRESLSLLQKYRDNVVIYDSLPYSEYIRLLWKADAVIGWHTNWWSIALLEAVACGCYPIVHNQTFFPEILPREYLLQPNEDSLYNAMRQVIDDPDYYRRKAESLAQLIREKYDWEKRISNWIDAYEKLYNIAGSRASTPTGDTIRKLVSFIEKKGHAKWSEIWRVMNWGYQHKIGQYGAYFWLTRHYKELPSPEPIWIVEHRKKKGLLEWI